jgi:hypothetical protein
MSAPAIQAKASMGVKNTAKAQEIGVLGPLARKNSVTQNAQGKLPHLWSSYSDYP